MQRTWGQAGMGGAARRSGGLSGQTATGRKEPRPISSSVNPDTSLPPTPELAVRSPSAPWWTGGRGRGAAASAGPMGSPGSTTHQSVPLGGPL